MKCGKLPAPDRLDVIKALERVCDASRTLTGMGVSCLFREVVVLSIAGFLAHAAPAAADVISNPANTYSFGSLSGSLTGGQQTQFVGETFTAPLTGALTDFKFTLNSSNLASLYAAVYAWDGSKPTALLWQSPMVAGTAGMLDFSPVGAKVTQGQTYVAFLSTYGIANNSGSATVGSCLNFGGCTANAIPNLGTFVEQYLSRLRAPSRDRSDTDALEYGPQ